MFEARPANVKSAESPLFNAVGRIGDAGKLTVTAARRGGRALGALSLFYMAFMLGIGLLAALVTASSMANVMLGCVIVGGLGYAGLRKLSGAIKG